MQYSFDSPVELTSTTIYWADNNRAWALPKHFRVLYRSGDDWKAIDAEIPRPKRDEAQTIDFTTIRTEAVRLEVIPQRNRTVGVLEWVVE